MSDESGDRPPPPESTDSGESEATKQEDEAPELPEPVEDGEGGSGGGGGEQQKEAEEQTADSQETADDETAPELAEPEAEQEDADAAAAEQAYERIRANTGDTERISENTGIDEGVLDQVKDHLFVQEHDLPMPPDGEVVTQRFTPDESISDLWEKAEAGTLTEQEREQFQGLMQHEAVESTLMEQGLPYRSADPAAWEDGVNWPSAENYGAHDLAPHAAYPDDPWRGWESMGFGDAPATAINRDLSNVDDVVAEIRDRMGI